MITDCLLTYNFIYKTKQLDGAAETVGLARGEDEGDLLGAFDLGDIVGDDEVSCNYHPKDVMTIKHCY